MNAKVIVVANNKGGVGKTSLVTNIGAAFARRNLKTLLVDFDGQANLTDSFKEERVIDSTIAEALKEGKPLPIIPIKKNLYLAPSNAETDSLDNRQARTLKAALQPLLAQFDYIIIDTPPSVGVLTLGALCSAQELIIPITAELSSFKGLTSTIKLFEQAREMNAQLSLLGIVLCFFDARKNLSKLIVEGVKRNFAGQLCNSTIRRNIAVAEAILEKEDIFSYSSRSKGAEDYSALAKELLKRLNHATKGKK